MENHGRNGYTPRAHESLQETQGGSMPLGSRLLQPTGGMGRAPGCTWRREPDDTGRSQCGVRPPSPSEKQHREHWDN